MRGRDLPNRRSAVAVVSFALTGLISLGPQAWAATRFMEFPIPTYGSAPWGIAPGAQALGTRAAEAALFVGGG